MLELLDYRRRVFDLYRTIRAQGTDNPRSYRRFIGERDDLFLHHSQSPLDSEQKTHFKGLRYFEYDVAYRVIAQLTPIIKPNRYTIELDDDGKFTMEQLGNVTFALPTGSGTLGVFWIAAYGGGVFIPFRDVTNQSDTYGGGRYLFDTIKGADLGNVGNALILDFNYAYHPSCYYNSSWVCPLAPPQNQLPIAVQAGEKRLDH